MKLLKITCPHCGKMVCDAMMAHIGKGGGTDE